MKKGVQLHAFFIWTNALISTIYDARRLCLGFYGITYKKEVLLS